jgi:hypothetical protein
MPVARWAIESAIVKYHRKIWRCGESGRSARAMALFHVAAHDRRQARQ